MHQQREQEFEDDRLIHKQEIEALQAKVQEEIKKRFLQQLGGGLGVDSKSRSTLDSKEDEKVAEPAEFNDEFQYENSEYQ